VWSQHHFTSDASADADAPQHLSSSRSRRGRGGSALSPADEASLWAVTKAAANYNDGETSSSFSHHKSPAVGAALRHRGVPRRLAMMLEPVQALPQGEAASVLAHARALAAGGNAGAAAAAGGGVVRSNGIRTMDAGLVSKLGRAARAGSSSSSKGEDDDGGVVVAPTPEWALDALAADADPVGEHAACRLHSYLPSEHPSMSPSASSSYPSSSSSSSSCAEGDAACSAALADAAPGLPPLAATAPLECADGYSPQGPSCVQRCPAGYGLPTLCADTLTCVRAGAPCPRGAEAARREVPFWCAAPGELLGGCAKQEYQVEAGGGGGGGVSGAAPPPQGLVAAEAAAAAGVARPLFGARGSLGRRLNLGGGGGTGESAAQQQQQQQEQEEERLRVAAAAAEAALAAEPLSPSRACRPGFAPFERAGEEQQEGGDAEAPAPSTAERGGAITTCRQRCPTGFLDCGQWCAMPGVACDGTGGQGTSTPAGFLPVTMVGRGSSGGSGSGGSSGSGSYSGSGSRHGGGLPPPAGGESGSQHHSTHNWSTRHSVGPVAVPAPPPPVDVNDDANQQNQAPRNVSSATAAAALVLPGRPMPLCKLAVGGCSLAAREQGALKAACAAAGHPSTSACPMALSLHGGCGGQRLHAASGVRRGATVRRIEAWWGVAGASAAAAAEAGASASNATTAITTTTAANNLAAIDQDAILALRLTYSQGAVQVLGNATLAAATGGSDGVGVGGEPPRGVLELSPGETIERVRTWRSRTLVDGATLTPVLGGFEITTSRGKRLLAGGGKDAAPGAALRDAAAAAAPRSGRSALAAAAADDGFVSSSDRTLVLDRGSAGLGTGVMVGAAAYTSPSAVGSLGFLFMRPQPQRNGGEL
jgi:hypothetical protein